MPDGACVVKYPGKRGVVWRIKYRDAAGKQVMETLGAAADGWTKRKAEAELRAHLTAVDKDGLRRIEPETFASFATGWLACYPRAKGLKRSTTQGYEQIVERHLIPALGSRQLDAIDVATGRAYIAAKLNAGYAGRTVNRHLNLLNEILRAALAEGKLRSNPVPLLADHRPKEERRRWTILSPPEIARVERAFGELIVAAKDEERRWREQARTIFLLLVGIGLRRGELLGLRWRDVDLADPDGAVLRVRETFVRGAADTPKSEAGERTIALGPRLAEELWQHRRQTAFAGDDERVFCSPTKGTPFDVVRYAATFREALAKAKIDRYTRPFHDGRHTNITNAAAAGLSPAALMARAGHSDYKTTQLYIDLAGQTFREEAELAEQRLLGAVQYKKPVESPASVAGDGNNTPSEPEAETAPEQGLPIERSGAGVEPTQPGAARPDRF